METNNLNIIILLVLIMIFCELSRLRLKDIKDLLKDIKDLLKQLNKENLL